MLGLEYLGDTNPIWPQGLILGCVAAANKLNWSYKPEYRFLSYEELKDYASLQANEPPDLRVPVTYIGVLPVKGVGADDGNHFVTAVITDGSTFSFYESLDEQHPGLNNAILDLGLEPSKCKVEVGVSSRLSTETNCGAAVVQNYLRALAYGAFSTEIAIAPGAFSSEELFVSAIKELASCELKAATASKDSIAPDAEDTDDAPVRAGSRRFKRPKEDRIVEVKDGVELEPGFQRGSHILRMRALTQEEASLVTTDAKLQQLLMLPMLVIPSQESVQSAISMAQRRRHLYCLADLLNIIKSQKWNHPLELSLVNALDALEEKRGWASPTTKKTLAQTLFGALERLDQYTSSQLPSLRLGLEKESSWTDANRKWMKDVCGHSPSLEEVTMEDIMQILTPGKTSLGAAALLILCWSSTGRPFNWLNVKREDLVLKVCEDEKGGCDLQITWRHHKTVGTRGAFTTHSWMPTIWFQKLKKWIDSVKGPYLFPMKLWGKITTDLKLALKQQNPNYDLKALRRGSLSTMARAGVPLETLKLFSGHKSDAMLLRYLRFGANAGDQQKRSRAAAMTLHQ